MPRPLTLLTGQWADLPLEQLAARSAAWGDGRLELACWGGRFHVAAVLSDPACARRLRVLLERDGLGRGARTAHRLGQAVCYAVDEPHPRILSLEIWGDGDSEMCAATRLEDAARACGGSCRSSGKTASWTASASLPKPSPSSGGPSSHPRPLPSTPRWRPAGSGERAEQVPRSWRPTSYIDQLAFDLVGWREGAAVRRRR